MGHPKGDLHSRAPIERMFRIHEQLNADRFPNCVRLAHHLEVNRRTIMRDIDFMKCRLNLPIEYDDLKHGYYYTNPVETFPGITVSESELFALLVARKAVAQYQGTPFEKPLAAAYRRLASTLGHDPALHFEDAGQLLEFRPLGRDDLDPELFDTLYRAARLQRVIEFRYRKVGARKPQLRSAHPYQLACIDHRWYLFALDLDRQALRSFVLARMSNVNVTTVTFERPRDWNIREYLQDSFGVFHHPNPADYEVVIEFDAWAADVLRGRQWHPSQRVTELPGGQVRLSFRLGNLEEIERWILSWGPHATAIKPRKLVQRLRKAIHELAHRYHHHSEDVD